MKLDDEKILDRYEEALRNLVGTLAHARVRHAELALAQAIVADFADQDLETAVDRYIEDSEALGQQLLDGMNEDDGAPLPDAGVSRLAANLGGDLSVASELARLAGEDPSTPALSPALGNALGVLYHDATDLQRSPFPGVDEIISGIRGLSVSGAADAPTDLAVVQKACSVLDTAGGSLKNTSSA